jgi:hypothetical protein
MTASASNATEIARRTMLKIDDDVVLSAVDGLDLRGHAKISAVVGMPLRSLQQRRDVAAFALSAPVPALQALLELLAMAPLEKVIEALGDHADAPNLEQLSSAIDVVRAGGATVNDVVAVLGFAISEGFPAAPSCRQLLLDVPEYELPNLPEVEASSTLLTPKETDPQIREQRRLRREQEKQRKRGPSSVRPTRPVKAKPSPKSASPAMAPLVDDTTRPVAERRRVLLTPSESERFDAEHALAGTVVIVEVPFDSTDPFAPEQKAKDRPALVVAASDDALLVRPIYSNSSPTRVTFGAWRRLGLDHVCYVDDARVAVPVTSVDSLERLGRLNDEEWNALL